MRSSSPRFMLVAPIRSDKLYRLPDAALEFGADAAEDALTQRFLSRRYTNAPFTSLQHVTNLSPEAIAQATSNPYRARLGGHDNGPQFSFDVLNAEMYSHFGMDILCAFVELRERAFNRTHRFKDATAQEIEQLEQATTYFMRALCNAHYHDKMHFVRWVSRTLILLEPKPIRPGDEQSRKDHRATPPDSWRQEDMAWTSVVLDNSVLASVGWANWVAWTPDPNYQFVDMRRSAVMAQYLWCFVSDIDTRSARVLSGVSRSPSSSRAQSSALHQVIELNFDMAVVSMFYERLGTESNVANRQLVVATLEAWGFKSTFDLIAERLQRLESIIQARSEMLSRRTSRTMEVILFALSVTGLLSIILASIGTAFSGESGGNGPWYPNSKILDWFRQVNLDAILVISLLAGLLLVFIVLGVQRAPLARGVWRSVRGDREDIEPDE